MPINGEKLWKVGKNPAVCCPKICNSCIISFMGSVFTLSMLFTGDLQHGSVTTGQGAEEKLFSTAKGVCAGGAFGCSVPTELRGTVLAELEGSDKWPLSLPIAAFE